MKKALIIDAVRKYGYLPWGKRHLFDHDVYLALVETDPKAIKEVPQKFLTRELFLAVVRRDGTLLSRISKEKRDLDLCMEAVRQAPEALRSVPEDLRQEVCDQVVATHPEHRLALEGLMIDLDVCGIAVRKMKEILATVPASMRQAVLRAAGAKDAGALVPEADVGSDGDAEVDVNATDPDRTSSAACIAA